MKQFEIKLAYENGRVITFYREFTDIEAAEEDVLAHISSGSTIKFNEAGAVGLLSFKGAQSYLITQKQRPESVEAITWN
ncbi:hypothetical protein ACLJJ6_09115 [Pediococcus siamensis]|uniref:hypothetical protein n=1 Tax=Pediococcus siamensis TaxID=381829 RepID=UPI0039A3ABD3